MTVLKFVLVVLAAYLIGSVSFSIWISRLMGNDIREHGSGNAGATNMTRTFGWGPGLLTLAGDMVKALTGMLLGYFMFGGEFGDPGALGDWGLMAGGMAVILGHCFPFTYDFRGGKGVATGGIISLMVHPIVGAAVFGSFIVFALLSKKVSVGSICGALAITVAAILVHVNTPRLLLSIFAMCVVIIQHRENIKRLLKGTEPDFHAKTKE
ncbi:MAG: glycerol-3-phosphate 1-O-acyltransferase PlsY [Oscillospiraceae bacterium]|nr:glycerol-3-phosphate 1-O-acyltransferase PlsY [Oscillospiraceae bacterium]